MLLDRAQRTVEMVLEDRVTYQMGTDAQGRAEFEQNASQFLRTELNAESVFPKGGPLKGEPEKTDRGTQGQHRRTAEAGPADRTGPSTTST